MGLPNNYVEGLPRVSSVCEFVHPFIGESKDRFHGWLAKNNISLVDYMEEASTGGTYVHKAMEIYGETGVWKGRKYKSIIEGGIKFHKDYNVKLIKSEHYIKCKEYQGTLDALVDINGEKFIIDYKSYGLAKEKFNLPNKYKKPYEKLRKARLQLSLYNRALKYKYKLAVVELTPSGYYFHILEQMPKEELEELIFLYKNNYIDQL